MSIAFDLAIVPARSSFMTVRIMSVTWSAVSFEMGPATGSLDLLVALHGEEVQGHERPAVGDGGERSGDLDHRHRDA